MPFPESHREASATAKKLRSYNDEHRIVEHKDVWDGAPGSELDDAPCTFLGFESVTISTNGHSPTESSERSPPRRGGRKRKLVPVTTARNSQRAYGSRLTPLSSQIPLKRRKPWDYSDRSPAKRGSNGWEECLRSRPAQVQHYQSIVIGKRRHFEDGETPVMSKRGKSTNGEQEIALDLEEAPERTLGDIVWAKLGSVRWWPAIIVSGEDCGQQASRDGLAWVFWFGDHKISEVTNDKVSDFTKKFSSRYTDNMGRTYIRSVNEALRECASRAKKDIQDADFASLVRWAKGDFKTDSGESNHSLFEPDPVNPIPGSVRTILNKIKALNLQYQIPDEIIPEEVEVSPVVPPVPPAVFPSVSELSAMRGGAISKVWRGTIGIKDVCIGCNLFGADIVAQHPLFDGGLCKGCKGNVVQTMFAYGDDGTNSYCVICSNAGQLVICDNIDCSRVYCTVCIELLVGPDARYKVLEENPWHCYMCTNYDKKRNGLIRRKDDWQQNVMKLFQPEKHIVLPHIDECTEKRPLRVLSLFDGIGTGIYALDQLGFEVEKYFASEIDEDAINITCFHHQTKVTQIGCVESLSDIKVEELCPIDLVIGGSPCNDLSLVNHARKGMYDPNGTGRLFFDFFRILKAVQMGNRSRHVFWLYENVAAMPNEYKNIITRFLQCDPVMIDSKYFTAQNRARYFWGNIPGMYSPLPPHISPHNCKLADIVITSCNRKALVEKVRTVTTRSNSLKQKKNCEYPINMNGRGEVLWLVEIERIFDFPDHYTDVGNLTFSKRQKMLGRAWSVPVIRYLFTPLKNFFKTKPNPPSKNGPLNSTTPSSSVSSPGSSST